MSPKGFATVVDLNLMGTFYLCKAAYEGYMGEHGGSIVNIVAECRNGFTGMVHTVSQNIFLFSSSQDVLLISVVYN
jgi:NAD(P)-dependent dehydrogenase (short-subunit alcohol dehydrogenase family)